MKLRELAGFSELSPELKAQICNGAGAKDDWKSILIPNTIYGMDCTEVFDRHDYAYHMGISREDKINADIQMFVNLIIKSIDHGGWLTMLRFIRSLWYFAAVYFKGNDAFYTEDKRNTHLKPKGFFG